MADAVQTGKVLSAGSMPAVASEMKRSIKALTIDRFA
jgi:hypothetical protein